MKLLYQQDMLVKPDKYTLNEMQTEFSLDESDIDYVIAVLNGVTRKQQTIDDIIRKYAKGWSIQRMAKVDLAILRLALYEIIERADIPESVSINEGVELAKRYCNEKSASFINGILGSYLRSLAGAVKE